MQQPSMSIAARLTAFLAERQVTPFTWPANNCCHLGAQWAQRLSGLDPMRGLPLTANARQAVKLLLRLGGMRNAWSKALGIEPIEPALAQTGDLVLVQLDAAIDGQSTGQAVGICNGTQVLVLDPAGQVHPIGWAGAVCAWRVQAAA